MMKLFLYTALFFFISIGCTKKNENEVWVYTSLYKDTIADIEPQLKKDLPGIHVRFFQAGSEDIAAKVNAELIAGHLKADILISSDRFWYEEMAQKNKLHPFQDESLDKLSSDLKHKSGLYNTLSLPVMVLAYNAEALQKGKTPKTFSEMADLEWKGKFSTGSPLSSGTNFTTVAFLSQKYGWDYFKKLQENGTISEGGNSAVLRRIQSKERPIGWVLLENLLRFQDKDQRLKTVFPEDGVVLHNNVLAITKKQGQRKNAEKVAGWLFGKKGQEAMIKSYMYSPFPAYSPPKGAPPLSEIKGKAFPWTDSFIQNIVKNREQIKEKFTEIMFK